MDRHDCYERCVQSTSDLVPFLRGVHGNEPTILREDFCGTAALSRAWPGRSIATDLDPEMLQQARQRAGTASIEFRLADALTATDADPADLIFVGNFSIGYIHDRATLVRYLTISRARLRDDGVFVCDTYGGATAFKSGSVERSHSAPDGTIIKYLWRQDHADPLTNRVQNSLHFRVIKDGVVVADCPDAFRYDWRLWSIAELREAMTEAGFATSEVYAHIGLDETLRPSRVKIAIELPDTWFVCLAGRLRARSGVSA